MEQKIEILFNYIKTLGETDPDRLIRFVLGIIH